MSARVKSIIACFISGILLCTLIFCVRPETTAVAAENISETEEAEAEGEGTEPLRLAAKDMSMRLRKAEYKAHKDETVESEDTQKDVREISEEDPEEYEEYEEEDDEGSYDIVVAVIEEDTSLNVREEPSQDGEIVGKLYTDGAGIVLESSDGWIKISSGDVEGWVSEEYAVTGDATQTYIEENVETVATVTEDGVRVRAEASVESDRIDRADEGDMYTLADDEYEVTDDDGLLWIKVISGGEEGYICADYVEIGPALGKALSIEEIRAKEAAKAAAEDPYYGWNCLGTFMITSYCGCEICSGYGRTASGTVPAAGRTIAVAPGVIPYGTQVMIDGLGVYVAEDTGGFASSNPYQIDVYVSDHATAASWGTCYRQVWVR